MILTDEQIGILKTAYFGTKRRVDKAYFDHVMPLVACGFMERVGYDTFIITPIGKSLCDVSELNALQFDKEGIAKPDKCSFFDAVNEFQKEEDG